MGAPQWRAGDGALARCSPCQVARLRLDWEVVDLERRHHPLDPVAAKDAEQVVVQGEEEPGAPRVALATGTAPAPQGWGASNRQERDRTGGTAALTAAGCRSAGTRAARCR